VETGGCTSKDLLDLLDYFALTKANMKLGMRPKNAEPNKRLEHTTHCALKTQMAGRVQNSEDSEIETLRVKNSPNHLPVHSRWSSVTFSVER
jgi:hypothetical protein